MNLYYGMNRFVKYFILLSMCISNAYAFASHIAKPTLPNKMQRKLCYTMSLFEHRMNRRDVCKIALSSAVPILLPKTSYADYEPDISWTVHNGPFQESDLKDYVQCKSGLLYKDVEEGKGPMPNEGDLVKIHMVGYIFETGEKWANTYKGIPTFQSAVRAGVRPNQKFMKGLNEGVLTMKKGGKRILVIPAYLAYNYVEMLSDKNPGTAIIPGGSSLVCYVEVLEFKKMD